MPCTSTHVGGCGPLGFVSLHRTSAPWTISYANVGAAVAGTDTLATVPRPRARAIATRSPRVRRPRDGLIDRATSPNARARAEDIDVDIAYRASTLARRPRVPSPRADDSPSRRPAIIIASISIIIIIIHTR